LAERFHTSTGEAGIPQPDVMKRVRVAASAGAATAPVAKTTQATTIKTTVRRRAARLDDEDLCTSAA